jgi:hypothetical protein
VGVRVPPTAPTYLIGTAIFWASSGWWVGQSTALVELAGGYGAR